MSTEDKQMFPCDTRELNWKAFIPDYVFGIRDYILGEERCTKTLFIMKPLHYFVKYTITLLMLYTAFNALKCCYYKIY